MLAIALLIAGCTQIGVLTPNSPPPTSSVTGSNAQEPGPTGPTQPAHVKRVVDGDTVIVTISGMDYRLRYIGMDTPETVAPGQPVERFGPEASAANKRLVDNKEVVLEKDVSETDRFGRLLRYVWLHDGNRWTMVNERLLELGYAQVATFPPDVKYVDRFLAAQRDAREADRGLWGRH
jgi:micrococcal nuclease